MKLATNLLFLGIGLLLGLMLQWKGCTDNPGPASPDIVKSDTSVNVEVLQVPEHHPIPDQVTQPVKGKDHNAIEWLSPPVITRIDSTEVKQWIEVAYAMQASRDSI